MLCRMRDRRTVMSLGRKSVINIGLSRLSESLKGPDNSLSGASINIGSLSSISVPIFVGKSGDLSCIEDRTEPLKPGKFVN